MRPLAIIVHNWPLKVAAVALSSVLYGGLILSQTTRDFPGSVLIQADRQPPTIVVLSDLGSVSHIRYVEPPDLGLRIDDSSFRASVDLGDVTVTGAPVSLTVKVVAVDSRIQVLDFEPRRISVTLDSVTTQTVPIRAVQVGTVPSGFELGEPVLDVSTATVRGPESLVKQVAEVQARYTIDPTGIDLNRVLNLVPVDATGQDLSQVDVDPTSVRVKVSVFTDRQTRTLPVSPVIVGTPAPGFEVESVTVDPVAVGVQGDANDLAGLDRADTDPVSVTGASSQVVQTVNLALPDGVEPLGVGSVRVTVSLRPVTATRSFEAGLVLVGASPDRRYDLSTDRVVVTIGGSVADLDRLSGSTITMNVDVGGLTDGTHQVEVSANLSTGLTLVAVSPKTVGVTVSTPVATTAPSPSPAPSATP